MRIKLHIGAHRTATTSLQGQLRQLAPKLEEMGIIYVPRYQQGRYHPLYALLRNPWHEGRSMSDARREFAQALEAICAGKAISDPQILLSDEDLMAAPLPRRHMFQRPVEGDFEDRLYPSIGRHMRGISQICAGHQLSLHMCVRHWDSFLSSYYWQFIRHGGDMSARSYEALLKSLSHDWVNIKNRIQTEIDGSDTSLFVAAYESLLTDPNGHYLQLFGDRALAELLQQHPLQDRKKASQSSASVAVLRLYGRMRRLLAGGLLGAAPHTPPRWVNKLANRLAGVGKRHHWADADFAATVRAKSEEQYVMLGLNRP